MMDALSKYDSPEAAESATPAEYSQFLRDNYGSAAGEIEKYYSLSLFESTPDPVVAAIATVITDSEYKCPGYRCAAQATRKNMPAWIYEFTHNSTCVWLDTMPYGGAAYFGAAHTAELPYVFGNLDFDFHNETCNGTQDEYGLSRQMMSLWTSMAERGKPSGDFVEWKQFQIMQKGSGTPAVIFGNSSVSGTIDFSACELWAQVDAMLSASNSTTAKTTTTTTMAVPSSSSGGKTSAPANSSASCRQQTSFITIGLLATLNALFDIINLALYI